MKRLGNAARVKLEIYQWLNMLNLFIYLFLLGKVKIKRRGEKTNKQKKPTILLTGGDFIRNLLMTSVGLGIPDQFSLVQEILYVCACDTTYMLNFPIRYCICDKSSSGLSFFNWKAEI